MQKLISVMLFLCFVSVSPTAAASDDPPVLTEVQQKIRAEFSRIDAAMQDAAGKLGASGLTGDAARASLAELCGKFAFAIDCTAVDTKGMMVTIEPSSYSQFEGTDISAQKQVKAIIKKHKPVMSSVFKAVEGFPAVDVEYPVFSLQGKYIGSVSLFFKPETLFAQLLPPLLKGFPVDIWAMEKGGRIIYDVDVSEIGQNLFTAPAYQPFTELLKIGRRIAAKPEGRGSYQYKIHGENIVGEKNAYWKSVALYGTEWRIVGVHVRKEASGKKSNQDSVSANPEEMLAALATDGKLIRALSHEDKKKTMKHFKAFYHATPGIYAIEWIDKNGVNRFGYPTGSSLVDYDYHQLRETGDQEILDLLTSRKKGKMELPLTEGGIGVFNFVPVLDGENYLGLIYIIRE